MNKNSNTSKISYINAKGEIHSGEYDKEAWEKWTNVLNALNVVVTLDKVNPKPLQRTGRDMKKALIDLFTAISEYDSVRKI